MIEKQVIVNWYTPEEKLPPDGMSVPATVSGESRGCRLDHALVMAEFYKGEGWNINDYMFDQDLKGAWLKVHAWADLEPYGGDANDARNKIEKG